MNTATSLCLAAVLLISVSADSRDKRASEPGYGNGPNVYGSGPSGYGNGPSVYGSGPSGYGSGYGSHGGFGPQGFGRRFGFPAFMSLGEEPVNELDQIYAELSTLLSQIKTYSEQVESLNARLSVQRKTLDEIVLVQIPDISEVDSAQTDAIDSLNGLLSDIETETETVGNSLNSLHDNNNANTDNQEQAQTLLAQQQAQNVNQERSIHSLWTGARNLKNIMLQVNGNEFAIISDRLESAEGLLDAIQARENRRMCEVGQVTLAGDDRKVQYQYQNKFEDVPHVTWGICGYNINLDAKEEAMTFGYGGYEPEALGTLVNVYSTTVGLAIEKFDQSFGDSKGVTTDVCFLSCTIGPGTGPVNH